MKPFETFESIVTPLPIRNVDTDMIIPAQFLTSVSREGFGENLFRRLRDGQPDFPLNLEKYKGSEILVASENFGCGSSREHAVWALMGAGFRVVISPSFADIFASNAAKNGLLLVELPEKVVETMLVEAAERSLTLSVDLKKQQLSLDDGTCYDFEYDPFRKHCLLQGLDDIDYILEQKDAINAFRKEQEQKRFYRTSAPNN